MAGQQVLCKGCGKPIECNGKSKHKCEEDGDGVVRISIGDVDSDEGGGKTKFKPNAEWGYMHRRCFRLVIGAPIV